MSEYLQKKSKQFMGSSQDKWEESVRHDAQCASSYGLNRSPLIVDSKKLSKVTKEFHNEARTIPLDRLPDGRLVNDTLSNDGEGVIMPLVNIEKDSTNSMLSFFADNAATFSKLKQLNLQQNPPLIHKLQHKQNKSHAQSMLQDPPNQVLRIKPTFNTEAYSPEDKQLLKIRERMLLPSNYNAFGQRDGKQLIKQFVPHYDSISRLKNQSKSNSQTRDPLHRDKVMKESYQSSTRVDGKIQSFHDIYDKYKTKYSQLNLGEKWPSRRGSLAHSQFSDQIKCEFNTSIANSPTQELVSCRGRHLNSLPPGGPYQDFSSQPSHISPQLIHVNSFYNQIVNQKRMKDQGSPKILSNQPSILYQNQKNNFSLINSTKKPAFMLDNMKISPIVSGTQAGELTDTERNTAKSKQQVSLQRQLLMKKGLAMNTSVYCNQQQRRNTKIDHSSITNKGIQEANGSQQAQAPQATSNFTSPRRTKQQSNFLMQMTHSTTLSNPSKIAGKCKKTQSLRQSKTGLKQALSCSHQNKQTNELRCMGFKIPNLSHTLQSMNDYEVQRRLESAQNLKRGISIEKKLMEITENVNTKTIAKQKRQSPAETNFYDYVGDRVGELGRISNKALLIRKKKFSKSLRQNQPRFESSNKVKT